jgi:hypothetical protein
MEGEIQNVQQESFQQPVPTPVKIGKFKASMILAKESWNLLKKDKEMMLFPVISVLLNLVCAVLICFAFFLVVLGGNPETLKNANVSGAIEAAFLFVLYFVSFFITIFFQAGIIAIAHGRLNGQDLTFGDGINSANQHIKKIFIWSLIGATVGTILRMISERSKLLGKIITSLLGAAWSILTFFIVPVIMLDELSVKDSLKKSAAIIGKTWGETLIINIGVGLYFMFLAMMGIFVFIASLFTGSGTFIAIVAGLLVLYLIALVVISSTLDTIFKIVLYEYADSGKVPEGFSEQVISMAFAKK